jgi:hypothetical protein
MNFLAIATQSEAKAKLLVKTGKITQADYDKLWAGSTGPVNKPTITEWEPEYSVGTAWVDFTYGKTEVMNFKRHGNPERWVNHAKSEASRRWGLKSWSNISYRVNNIEGDVGNPALNSGDVMSQTELGIFYKVMDDGVKFRRSFPNFRPFINMSVEEAVELVNATLYWNYDIKKVMDMMYKEAASRFEKDNPKVAQDIRRGLITINEAVEQIYW